MKLKMNRLRAEFFDPSDISTRDPNSSGALRSCQSGNDLFRTPCTCPASLVLHPPENENIEESKKCWNFSLTFPLVQIIADLTSGSHIALSNDCKIAWCGYAFTFNFSSDLQADRGESSSRCEGIGWRARRRTKDGQDAERAEQAEVRVGEKGAELSYWGHLSTSAAIEFWTCILSGIGGIASYRYSIPYMGVEPVQ